MKLIELVNILDAKVVSMPHPDSEFSGGYCGDLLSFVMGRAPQMCAWFTIMNNTNVAAVATLADIAVVVLCDGVQPDALLVQAAQDKDLALIVTKLPVFEAVRKI